MARSVVSELGRSRSGRIASSKEVVVAYRVAGRPVPSPSARRFLSITRFPAFGPRSGQRMIDMDHKAVQFFYCANESGSTMRIAITNAKGQLTELVRRAQAGAEVVLTRHGRSGGAAGAGRGPGRSQSPQGVARSGAGVRRQEGAGWGKCCAEPGFSLWHGRLARMIAVDTSVLMAIALGEPEADACIGILAAEPEIVRG